MSRPVRVEVREPGSAPRPLTLGLVAVLSLVGGATAVRATLRPATAVGESQTARDSVGSDAEADADADSTSDADSDSNSDAHPLANSAVDPEPDSDARLGPESVPDRDPAEGVAAAHALRGGSPAIPSSWVSDTDAATANRRVVPGRVAYLRCEGAPPARGPYPCPRDLELERAAWAILTALPSCPMVPPETGEADVRIAFVAGAPPEARLRPTRGDERELDGARLLACLREPFSALTTTIPSNDLVVSFRFDVVAR